ncbi:MAG: acyclic terpene utilization AtuA family protein [Pseudomonadota bacterium]
MVKVLIPSGALGLKYDRAALANGLAEGPDIIAIDGGSTDSGPSYLGRGISKYSRASTKAEWRDLMVARAEIGVPLLIGTAGTCGADPAVDWLLEITKELAAELGQSLKIAVLHSEQPPARVSAALASGKVTPLAPELQINADVIADCRHIVALAGAEQIQAALETGADIVIAGRTTDTAVIAALPLARGCDAGGAWHGAKIGECGALATTNPNAGTILIAFDAEGFTVTPMAAQGSATPRSVSAHMLYENSNPFVLYEPGGHLDVHAARYEAQGRSCRVTGSQWVPSEDYTVKLEGARCVGFQTISLTLVRDPRYVARVEEWLELIRADILAPVQDNDFVVEFRLVGQSATLGELDQHKIAPGEIGVLTIVTAQDQARATEIAKLLNPALLHYPLTKDEPMPTFAFPFSPNEIERGAQYEFCLNHVMHLDDPMEAFSLEVVDI